MDKEFSSNDILSFLKIMWIANSLYKTNKNLPIFYKKFKLEKPLKKAILSVSALGIISVKINGKQIDDYFMPGWTNYNVYANLCKYDITKDLKRDNLIEITLADGWYSGRLGYTKQPNVYGRVNALFAQIDLRFKDGDNRLIDSDTTWKVGKTNIISSSFFDGEEIDFNFVDGRKYGELPFAKAIAKDVRLKSCDCQPVRQICKLTPEVVVNGDGVLRLDFKQNFVGFITFTARGEKGATVTVNHAEMLCEDGSLYLDNLRSVKATNRAILSGGNDYFEPKFTFQGFRYAEILTDGKTQIENIRGIVLSQDIDYTGKFECSDEIINKIYQNALWGQKGNFISIPTDCPQRDERLGWTGDAQVFCNSAMFNADCNKFFTNYLRLIQTDILTDGKIPSFVPFFIPVSPSTAGVPGWADSICVIPYYHYLHYGDKKVLKENLPYAIRHLDYYLSKCDKNLLIDIVNPFGDWLSVEKADDKGVINQCFLGLSASLISKICGILGYGKKQLKYSQIYEKAKSAFRNNFLSEGKIKGDSQTAYAFALAVEYVTAEEIRDGFISSVQRAGDKLTTGFIGVKHLLPSLCKIGQTDLAYKIIKQTEYPSWGYTIKQGATTIWERWNGYTTENGFETPSMNSFNHYSLGSCVEWLYSHVLGVKLLESGKVRVSPSFSKELDFAKGECMTQNGKIYVEWQRNLDEFTLQVTSNRIDEVEIEITDKKIVSIEKIQNKIIATIA